MDVESRGPEGSRVFLRESFTFALEKKTKNSMCCGKAIKLLFRRFLNIMVIKHNLLFLFVDENRVSYKQDWR